MKKIIITADDYGLSHSVNKAINEGIDSGIITSTNVMVNMPFYKEAINLKKRNVSVGLHWNLTCGKPVSHRKDVKTLINNNGDFYSYNEFRERFRKGKINSTEILKELHAQYDIFYELLGAPDYWNTHENCHVDFKIFGIFVDAAIDMKIKKMRSHQRIYVKPKAGNSSYPIKWLIMEPFKSKILDLWQYYAHRKGLHSPDGRICCLYDPDSLDLRYVLQNIDWKKKGIAECVYHPATELDSSYFGEMTSSRLIEYNIVTDRRIHSYFKKSNIKLVDFDSI